MLESWFEYVKINFYIFLGICFSTFIGWLIYDNFREIFHSWKDLEDIDFAKRFINEALLMPTYSQEEEDIIYFEINAISDRKIDLIIEFLFGKEKDNPDAEVYKVKDKRKFLIEYIKKEREVNKLFHKSLDED